MYIYIYIYTYTIRIRIQYTRNHMQTMYQLYTQKRPEQTKQLLFLQFLQLVWSHLNPVDPRIFLLQPCLARPQRGDVSRWIQDGDCLRSWELLLESRPWKWWKWLNLLNFHDLKHSEATIKKTIWWKWRRHLLQHDFLHGQEPWCSWLQKIRLPHGQFQHVRRIRSQKANSPDICWAAKVTLTWASWAAYSSYSFKVKARGQIRCLTSWSKLPRCSFPEGPPMSYLPPHTPPRRLPPASPLTCCGYGRYEQVETHQNHSKPNAGTTFYKTQLIQWVPKLASFCVQFSHGGATNLGSVHFVIQLINPIIGHWSSQPGGSLDPLTMGLSLRFPHEEADWIAVWFQGVLLAVLKVLTLSILMLHEKTCPNPRLMRLALPKLVCLSPLPIGKVPGWRTEIARTCMTKQLEIRMLSEQWILRNRNF